jgi:putative component of toxin-antitoxin plasmid stabilization module
LLFQRRAPKNDIPDSYLVVVSSDVHGTIDFSSGAWKSVFSRVIAASHLRDKQEAMLLMNTGDWVQTSTGFWQLSVGSGPGQRATLTLVGGKTSA